MSINTARTGSAQTSLRTTRHPWPCALPLAHIQNFFFWSFFTFHFKPVIHRCHSRSTYFSKQLLPIPMLQPDTYYGAGPFRHKRLRDKTKRRRTKNRNSRAQRQLTPWGCFCPALPWLGTAFPVSLLYPPCLSKPQVWHPLGKPPGRNPISLSAPPTARYSGSANGVFLAAAGWLVDPSCGGGGRFPEPVRSRYEQQRCIQAHAIQVQ